MLRLMCFLCVCVLSTKSQNPICFNGWSHFAKSNKCLKVFGGAFDGVSPSKWELAEDYCWRFSGGNLASFHSDEEIVFVVELSHSAITHDDGMGAPIFMGLTYHFEWEWSDGSSVTYLKWWNATTANNSDSAGRNPAGILYTRRQWAGFMDISPANQHYPFVCQAPPVNDG